MKYNHKNHHRRSIRLRGYDYSQAGLYFITICIQNRECLFGEIMDGAMASNGAGKMVENEWLQLPQRFNKIKGGYPLGRYNENRGYQLKPNTRE